MPYSSKFGRFHVPQDGEEATPDGVNGPLQSVGATESWGDSLQTDYNILEEECPMIGPLADRPAAGDGLNLYYATDPDEENWYYNDSGTWVKNPASASGELTSLSVSGWNLVDVSNEGYDGTGSKDLADVFATYGTETIYILPEGTYRLDGAITDSTAFDYIGFVGKPEATIDVQTNNDPHTFLFGGTSSPCNRFILKNITVDISGTDASGFDLDRGLIQSSITDYAVVENVTLSGTRHRYQDTDGDGALETVGDRETVIINCKNKDTFAHVKNLKMPDGGTYESAKSQVGHAIGVASGGVNNTGTTVFEGCTVNNFIDNGFYVKNDQSRVFLLGCTAKNNGNSNIRPGNNDIVHACRSVIDNSSNRGYTTTGFLVQESENCHISALEIVATDADNDVVRVEGNSRSVTMDNVKVEIGSSVTMDLQGSTEGEGITLRNWTVDDTGGNTAQNCTFKVKRPDVTFRDCEIRSTNKFCIKQESGDSLTVDNCYLETGKSHLLLGNNGGITLDDLTVRNTTFGSGGTGSGGFYLYSGDTIRRINVTNCDFTGISSPKGDVYGDDQEWRSVSNRNFGGDELGAVAVDSLEVPKGTTARPYANTGEYVLLASASQSSGTSQTTSTTYATVLGNNLNHRVLMPSAAAADWANIANTYVSFVIRMNNDTTGETTYARLVDGDGSQVVTGTEVSVTGTTPTTVHSPRVQWSPGQRFWLVEGRVTAGTGEYEGNPNILLWGEVA